MTIELELHGYKTYLAIEKIENVIKRNPNCRCIKAIHGFNRGTSIKETILNEFEVSDKIDMILPEPFNEGVTLIYLK